MKHLIIAGAGEFGRELYWHARMSKGYHETFDIKGYIDSDMNPESEKYKELQKPLLNSIEAYEIQKDDVFICAVGSITGRVKVVSQLTGKGAEFFSLIHKTSVVQGSKSIGTGVFIGPFAVIGDNVKIGNHVMLNTHSSIGHDAVIGDYTCVMSYVDITGCCRIGERVFLGSGCRMVPSTVICRDAYVGIGSVVLRRVKEGTKVFGNPAKVYNI